MRKNVLIGLALAISLAAMAGCKGGKKVVETEVTQAVAVKTMEAAAESVDYTAEFTSNIEGYKVNNIAPAAPGRIDKILVDVGTRVYRGQLLAGMDPTEFNRLNIQFTNTKADHERIKAVYEAGGISRQQMEQIDAQMRSEQEQYNNMKVNINLPSPIDGVVTARNYDPGDLYNGQTPILTVMQINRLKVRVNVSENYFPLVKLGMTAQISVDMYKDRTFPGKVTLISPAVDPNTRTFMVEIDIPNTEGDLRPGMFSRTTLNFGKMEGIMVLDVAVQRQVGSAEKYVYVAKDGKAERRIVTTGRQEGDRVEILSGITAGDVVIVSGISRLVSGSEIEIKND